MKIREWQDKLREWHDWTWGRSTPFGRAAKLTEEIGEATAAWMDVVIANGKISEYLVKTAQGHPNARELDLGGEVADVFITLAVFCSYAGLDLEKEVEAKATVVWNRTGWTGR